MKWLKFREAREFVKSVTNSEKMLSFLQNVFILMCMEWKSRLLTKNLNKIAMERWRIPCYRCRDRGVYAIDSAEKNHATVVAEQPQKRHLIQPIWPKANVTTNWTVQNSKEKVKMSCGLFFFTAVDSVVVKFKRGEKIATMCRLPSLLLYSYSLLYFSFVNSSV